MAVSSKDSSKLWEKVTEKVVRTMDLLLIYDQDFNLKMAAACMDIINWQLRELQSNDDVVSEGGVDIYTYNFWRSSLYTEEEIKKDLEKGILVLVDRECRERIASQWLVYRLMPEKKGFSKRNKAQSFMKMMKILINSACAMRNDIWENRKILGDKLDADELIVSPVVLKFIKFPKCFFEHKNILDAGIGLTRDHAKHILREANRILCVAQVNHNDLLINETELFAAPFEKWIDSLFDFCEGSRTNSQGSQVLVAHILPHQYLKTYLKTYNIFEKVRIVRPEGSYTEVKYSSYFQNVFLKWRLSQSFTMIYQNYFTLATLNVGLEEMDMNQIYILLSQLFGWVVGEAGLFVFSFTVLRDFWASKDKINFLKGLDPKKRSAIDLYNRITLMMYRRPTVVPIIELVSGDISEPERKRAINEMFEEVLKDVKKKNCSQFKFLLEKMDFKEREEKFKALASQNNSREDRPFFNEEIYSENRSDDPKKGLQEMLKHYLNPKADQ